VEKVEVDIVSVNIKPLEDRLVVKPLEAEQTTASGLVIPDTAKEKPQEGEVVAIGPGRIDDNGNRVPLDVAVGDKVIYSKYGGTEVKYAGEEFLILSARDVLAVVYRSSRFVCLRTCRGARPGTRPGPISRDFRRESNAEDS
jgi:chaperonin GroES